MTLPLLSYPWLLLATPFIPLLIWRWIVQPSATLRFSDTATLTGLPTGRGRVARAGGAILRTLMLLGLLVALAGPRWPDLSTRIDTEGLAIVLLVDVSGSMAEQDFDWQGENISRLDAVKRAFRLFVAGGEGPEGERLEARPNDLIGVIAFATRPESLCPLTLSHSVLLQMLDAERPRSVPTESETNLGDAIAWGLHQLEAAGPRRKVLVLLSDGEHNVPPPALTARQAAQLAAGLGVPVYAIDAGGDSVEGEKAMQAVARRTGGRAFQAADTAGLLAACREIDQLERQPIQSFQYRRYYEGYPWFALAALGGWVLVHVLEWTVWRRLP